MTHSQLIEDSEKLINWLDQQIDGLDVRPDFRHRVAGGCLDVTMEYQKAIVLLVAKSIYGPAFSLHFGKNFVLMRFQLLNIFKSYAIRRKLQSKQTMMMMKFWKY